MVFFDSHAHLDSFGEELEQVLARAAMAGVTHLITIGASDGMKPNHDAVKIAETHDNVWAVVGVHPHDARIVDDQVVAEIEQLAAHPKVVAIGEMGLDFHYDHSPREAQAEAFRRFLRLARRAGKPIVVHTREADAETVEILREERADEIGGIIHCFTGTDVLAQAAVDLGMFVSFSGVITFRNAEPLREIARSLPRDRVLIETDCPYLAPIPHRGKRNEPAYVVHTAEKLAELWDEPLEEVKRRTGENARRAFRL